MAKSGTQLGLVDLGSDVFLVEAASGQVWYYNQVSFTFGEPLSHDDLWYPLVVASCSQEWY